MITRITRMLEEVLPFVYTFVYTSKIEKRMKKHPGKNNDLYEKLDDAELKSRIKEEHERAKFLDDKTFKMTLSLTIGLTILNSTFAFLIGNIDNNLLKLSFILLIWVSVTYILSGGFIAFSSLTTQKTYGYGTDFLLQCKRGNRSQCCEALHLQEESNLIRHIKNESSYQCLRNGFFLLFFVFMVYFFDLVIELIRDMQKA